MFFFLATVMILAAFGDIRIMRTGVPRGALPILLVFGAMFYWFWLWRLRCRRAGDFEPFTAIGETEVLSFVDTPGTESLHEGEVTPEF